MPADINDFNLSAVGKKMKKKDGTTVSVMWVHGIVSGQWKANEYWIKQLSSVTHIPPDILRAQIKRNREMNALPARRGVSKTKLLKSAKKHKH